jgi:O-antigen ligase
MTSPLPVAELIERVANNAPSIKSHESSVLYGALGLLLFGPLAFGATDPWSIFVLELGSALLFSAWAISHIRAGALCIRGNRLFVPMLAFAIVPAIQWFGARTASKEKTFSTAMLFVAYGLLSFLLVQSLRHTQQVRNIARTICFYGSVLAAFAVVQGLSSDGKVYWLLTPRFAGWVYGPYVNHNHYAGLMEMLTPIPLVISSSRHASSQDRWLAGCAAAIMGSSILLSGSRGGLIALATEMFLLTLVLVWQRSDSKPIAGILAIAAVILVLFFWLGSSQLTERLSSIPAAENTEVSTGTRLNLDRDALRMFAQRPLLGWGLGTFPVVYPQFRSFYTDLYVDHAHNDYIQLLVETGVTGFCLTLWFLATAVSGSVRKISEYRFHANGRIGLACLLGITGILVHSFVDFNLEIPANAAIFFCLCAVATAEHGFGPRVRSGMISRETN